MTNKEWHRDKIVELKLFREWYIEIQKMIVPIILGLGALFLAMLAIYFPNKEKYIEQIYSGTCIILIFIIILIIMNFLAYSRMKYYDIRIKRNFDILLDRKE